MTTGIGPPTNSSTQAGAAALKGPTEESTGAVSVAETPAPALDTHEAGIRRQVEVARGLLSALQAGVTQAQVGMPPGIACVSKRFPSVRCLCPRYLFGVHACRASTTVSQAAQLAAAMSIPGLTLQEVHARCRDSRVSFGRSVPECCRSGDDRCSFNPEVSGQPSRILDSLLKERLKAHSG